MKTNPVFLAELYVGRCKIAHQLPSKISLSFRIGKTIAQCTLERAAHNGEVPLNATLQLNADQLALDTQRSSLTLSAVAPNGQITVLGMALIPLARDAPHPPRKLRLTQCPDKNAEVEVQLTITPLDSLAAEGNNMMMTLRSSGVSSNRSIMEMQEFDKKMISPPKLFALVEKEPRLTLQLPPKPRSAKELPSHNEDLRESVTRLQTECDCLKQLLKVEIKKGDASNKIIDSLVNALEEVNNSSHHSHHSQHHTELDETLLLDGIDKEDTTDKVTHRNAQLEREIAALHVTIDQLRIENKALQQKSNESTRLSSREALNNLKEIPPRQGTLVESPRKGDKLAMEVGQLQAELVEKLEQLERFKKRMKLGAKLPGLESAPVERQGSAIATLRLSIDRLLHSNRELTKALLRYVKLEADSQTDGFLSRIKQKIDRTFGSLIAKKMNRDIVLYEKGELVKAVEELWQKSSFP